MRYKIYCFFAYLKERNTLLDACPGNFNCKANGNEDTI